MAVYEVVKQRSSGKAVVVATVSCCSMVRETDATARPVFYDDDEHMVLFLVNPTLYKVREVAPDE